MKTIGNAASNAIYNPNEALHPPPTATGSDERDSEMEKYIRRKYEQGAFKPGASSRPGQAPTSLNRARERDGLVPSNSSSTWSSTGDMSGNTSSRSFGRVSVNNRNPELNDVVIKNEKRERDLPALPPSAGGAPPRPRPIKSPSNNDVTYASQIPVPGSTPVKGIINPNPFGIGEGASKLVDLEGGTSSTLPLQVNGYGGQSHQQHISPYTGGMTSSLPTSPFNPGNPAGFNGLSNGANGFLNPGPSSFPTNQYSPVPQNNPFFAQQSPGFVQMPNGQLSPNPFSQPSPYHTPQTASPFQQSPHAPSPFQNSQTHQQYPFPQQYTGMQSGFNGHMAMPNYMGMPNGQMGGFNGQQQNGFGGQMPMYGNSTGMPYANGTMR